MAWWSGRRRPGARDEVGEHVDGVTLPQLAEPFRAVPGGPVARLQDRLFQAVLDRQTAKGLREAYAERHKEVRGASGDGIPAKIDQAAVLWAGRARAGLYPRDRAKILAGHLEAMADYYATRGPLLPGVAGLAAMGAAMRQSADMLTEAAHAKSVGYAAHALDTALDTVVMDVVTAYAGNDGHTRAQGALDFAAEAADARLHRATFHSLTQDNPVERVGRDFEKVAGVLFRDTVAAPWLEMPPTRAELAERSAVQAGIELLSLQALKMQAEAASHPFAAAEPPLPPDPLDIPESPGPPSPSSQTPPVEPGLQALARAAREGLAAGASRDNASSDNPTSDNGRNTSARLGNRAVQRGASVTSPSGVWASGAPPMRGTASRREADPGLGRALGNERG